MSNRPQRQSAADKALKRDMVAEFVDRLHVLRDVGRESLQTYPDHLPQDGDIWVDGERFRSTKLVKMRLLAGRVDGKELEAIRKLCREHGKVIGETSFLLISAVSNRQTRLQLVERALAGDWSARQVQRRCRRHLTFATRQTVGRQPSICRTKAERKDQLKRHCSSFLRLCQQLVLTSERAPRSQRFDDAVLVPLEEAIKTVRVLADALGDVKLS